MAKKITEQQLKQMIGYWIEVRHINCDIENLVEDTDEIGELYEYSLWTKNDQDGEDTSIMDVHVLLEAASDRSYDVLRIIEDGFLNVLKMCKQYYPALIFGDYAEKIDDATLERIEEELLYYPIDELYEYSTEEQFANFCTAIYHICREVIDGVEDDYLDDEDVELPFD